MLHLALVAIALAGSQAAASTTPVQPASTPLEAQEVALDRTGAAQLTEEQRRVVVCPRRAPTGSRLARTWCERRADQEARAQAARESHEEHILGTGWMDPEAAGGGPR